MARLAVTMVGRWAERPREIALAGLAVALGVVVGWAGAAVSPLLIVGAAAGLVWVAAVLQRPAFGVASVFAVATVLPFGVLPVPGGGMRPTFLDVAVTLSLLAWLLLALTDPRRRPVGTPLDLFVGLLLAVLGVAFVAGWGYGISSEGLRLYLKLLNSVLFFFTVVQALRTEGDIRLGYGVLVGGGAVAAVLGIVLSVLPAEVAVRALSALRIVGYPSGPDVLRYLADTNVLRATGTSIDPNVFGATLLMTGTLAAAGAAMRRPPVDRRLLIGAAAVIALCLLLTRSRGSQAGLVAGLGFVALLRYRRLALWLGLGGVVVLAGVLPPEINPVGHFLTGLRAGDRATQMRLGEYRDALELIGRYPWFGVGFGNAPSMDLYVGVSSAYLLLASQAGLVGLAAFLLALAALYVWALTADVLQRRDPAAEIALAGLAAVTGALVGALADHHYFNQRFPHTVALLWGTVGLTAAALRDPPSEPDREPGSVPERAELTGVAPRHAPFEPEVRP